MRCFEAFGAGCALLTDTGSYPPGMVDGGTMLAYEEAADAGQKLEVLLEQGALRSRIARAGQQMIRDRYSKGAQLARFYELLD